jgi:hypothetical protein
MTSTPCSKRHPPTLTTILPSSHPSILPSSHPPVFSSSRLLILPSSHPPVFRPPSSPYPSSVVRRPSSFFETPRRRATVCLIRARSRSTFHNRACLRYELLLTHPSTVSRGPLQDTLPTGTLASLVYRLFYKDPALPLNWWSNVSLAHSVHHDMRC